MEKALENSEQQQLKEKNKVGWRAGDTQKENLQTHILQRKHI